ncbi:hypothetical protein [Candidatus Pyrohabitans sp.]
MRERRETAALTAVMVAVYVGLAYAISHTSGSSIAQAVAVLLLLLPVPGMVAFIHGLRSGSSSISFLVGFTPVFVFFMTGALFGAFEGVPVVSGLFLGACSGIVGYSGAIKKRGEGDWVVFMLIGILLWIFVMLGSML